MNIEDLIQRRLITDTDNLIVYVPSKMPKALNHVDKTLLLEIHKDESTAKEIVLFFLSFFARTICGGNVTEVCLNSKVLSKLLAPAKYTKVIKACLSGTHDKGPFIDRGKNYSAGNYSKICKFTEGYLKCPAVKYKLKTQLVKDMYLRYLVNLSAREKNNPIIHNLLQFYSNPGLDIRTRIDVLDEGKRLAAEKFVTKSGKLLLLKNRNPLSRFEKKYDLKKITFVENNIRLYEYLTDPCFLVPMPQGINGGNRITDTFTLMPSWIRKLIKVNGQPLIELDFTALHPNIIMSLYGGKHKFLTHDQIATSIGIKSGKEMKEFKQDHLAFFNKHPQQMHKSEKIMQYYKIHEPEMLQKLIRDKEDFHHSYTSKLMFRKEVEIMTDCIKKLNALGIYVLYVYDALLCEPEHKDTAKRIMNETVLEHGVFTTVKEPDVSEMPLATEGGEPNAIGTSNLCLVVDEFDNGIVRPTPRALGKNPKIEYVAEIHQGAA